MPWMSFDVDPGPVSREKARILRQAILDTVRHLVEMPDDDLKAIGMGLMHSVKEMEIEVFWEST